MPELLNFRFQRDDILQILLPCQWKYWHRVLNCKNTELKRSSKIFFSVSERHRWAVVG